MNDMKPKSVAAVIQRVVCKKSLENVVALWEQHEEI